ncbi:hypothetical protein SEA_ERUTAN_13 [Gordonia phage Erutan]|uniref:Scaffolding protein n=1 Tax=Gordonia phage Erutan TaxID=3043913 RepID=A0AA96K045_9CAUD|nr:hypothetical protein SEA_ERUTAN_13 [Gordonia phage Erutan]
MYGLKPLKALSEATAIPFWSLSIYGAEGEEGGDGGDGQGGGDDDGGDDDGGDDEGGDDKTDFSAISDPKERRIAELSDEAAKARIAKREMKKEHTTQINDLNKRIKELEKAAKGGEGGPEITDEIRAEIEQPHIEKIGHLEKFAYRQAIENAILKESVAEGAARRVWFDTSDVIANLDMDAIDFDLESGSIDGIADELNRIASAKPHLVKEKGKVKKKEDDGQQTRRGASGRQPGGAGAQIHGMDKSRRDELGAKYPVLNRR